MSRVELHPGYSHEILRVWQADGGPAPNRLVWPLFVTDKPGAREPIEAMPGQFRWGVGRLHEALDKPVAAGLRAVLLFGVPRDGKDATGSRADSDRSPVVRALASLRAAYPELLLIADVCLCAWTDHGHCGLLRPDGTVDNDATIARLARIAAAYAAAGAHVVAPSDMMDNRVAAIRAALREAGRPSCAILSYAVKFASVFYGPFREAARSAPAFGDRRAYQLPPAARRLALRAARRDVEEGADALIVKPGLPCLDLVREVRESVPVPVLAYQVSGEFAMLWHAAAAGAMDLRAATLETITAFHRAGAAAVVSYLAPALIEWMSSSPPRGTEGTPGRRPTRLRRLAARRRRQP
ncbi:MAG: porphobilinogen synthase [Kiritimatiellae bacterium]|nr:porphobilinogen synthase [Kiritimatiellia bacterium]